MKLILSSVLVLAGSFLFVEELAHPISGAAHYGILALLAAVTIWNTMALIRD